MDLPSVALGYALGTVFTLATIVAVESIFRNTRDRQEAQLWRKTTRTVVRLADLLGERLEQMSEARDDPADPIPPEG